MHNRLYLQIPIREGKMKRVTFLAVFLILVGQGFAAASQVEFVAAIKSIDIEGTEAATIIMTLTPTFDLTVAVTGMTEIRGEGDIELTIPDLEAGMILKVEGIFMEGGILAKEIQVFEGVAEFEVKGEIEAIDTAASTITVAGIIIKVDAETEIRGAFGPITLADLQVEETVKVEGEIGEELLATEIRVVQTGFRPPRIAFEGIITEINEGSILVLVEGVDNVLVRIDEQTDVKGTLVLGASVRVNGTIIEDLSVAARKIIVQRVMQLAPPRLLNLKVGQVHPVEIVLQSLSQEDIEVAVACADTDVAEVNPNTVLIPAGKLSGTFEVLAKTVGQTTIVVTLPAELGSMEAVLPVQVTARGGEVDKPLPPGKFEMRWAPAGLKLWVGQTRRAMVQLQRAAPEAIEVTLSLAQGDVGVVVFPETVEVPKGERFVVVEFVTGEKTGFVVVQAALTTSGETANLEVEVKSR
jgi:hypothetical protein